MLKRDSEGEKVINLFLCFLISSLKFTSAVLAQSDGQVDGFGPLKKSGWGTVIYSPEGKYFASMDFNNDQVVVTDRDLSQSFGTVTWEGRIPRVIHGDQDQEIRLTLRIGWEKSIQK